MAGNEKKFKKREKTYTWGTQNFDKRNRESGLQKSVFDEAPYLTHQEQRID